MRSATCSVSATTSYRSSSKRCEPGRVRMPGIMASEPADLRKANAAAPKAKAQWADLTPIARRDFISWIDSAKQAETRRRRIERASDMVASGKRRACCFDVVPLDLQAMPKAKAAWSGLDSDARRDLIDWIQSTKQRDARKDRIEEACASLATRGKPPKTA